MTAMRASSVARSTRLVDADELFMNLSVPELNVYERRTRQDIESKKQELRTMVGERYRDLIGAADCIVRMKETAFAVQDNIARMRNSCDIHALKRNVAAKTKKAQSGAMDEMKKSLYTSAAQIKLLADVPEQIWKNMENNSYLTASRLYLISKAIYKNLNAGMEGNDDEGKMVKVMETFPVVGRQWDAVSHFKAQILQKSHHHLKAYNEGDLDVVETICAIMLLDDVTMKDMFRLFLAQRQTAIREVLDTKGEDLGAQIVQAIKILQATLFHIAHVFLETDKDKFSPLERHLRSLQQTFTTPINNTPSTQLFSTLTSVSSSARDEILAPSALPASTAHSLTASVIPKLYPTTPNIHLLVRYLPESIQNFTPFIHLTGARATFTQQDVFQGVQRWMEDVKTMISNGFEQLLQQVQTSMDLVAIRSKVWSVLRTDEFALSTQATQDQQQQMKSAFNDVCRVLLGESFSIWDSILRSGFTRAFQDIIVFSLDELSNQPEKLLRPRLGELDLEDDDNHDIGKFVWNDVATAKGATLPSSTEALNQKIRDTLDAIRLDQERALAGDRIALEYKEEEDMDRYESVDLFGVKVDTQALVEFYQRHCVECIKAYTSGLEQLVQEAIRKPEKARNTIPALDRSMTIGRVALGIASKGMALQRALTPPGHHSSISNFVQARAAKANVDAQVQGLIAGMNKVYLFSHEAWIENAEWTLNRGIKSYLKGSSWTDLATLAWEPIPSANSAPSSTKGFSLASSAALTLNAAAGDEAKTLLPFHCSTRLISALHQIVQEMHRVGTGFMKPELVQILTIKLATVVLHDIDQFLNDVVDPSALSGSSTVTDPEKAPVVLSEKGALQLLFDVKFLNLVFQSSIDKDKELSRLSRAVLDRIRGHIDPINLAVFEKPLDTNADRQYSRVAVLLGLLVQLNPTESSKRKVNVTEKSPHVFAMAPLTARFTLLPIGQKIAGRVL
ncbi:Golgi transport complex subunit 1 [Gamsiella multidivaricata]|nr:Golgi transport complex subunit 1 [Gamsiella multidivaricata]